MSVKEREDIVKKAEQCHLKGGIHKDALDFLTGWAKGTKRRDPRLQHYSFFGPSVQFHARKCCAKTISARPASQAETYCRPAA